MVHATGPLIPATGHATRPLHPGRPPASRALLTGAAGAAVRWRLYGLREATRAHAPGELHGQVLAHAPVDRGAIQGADPHSALRIRGQVAGNGCAAFAAADLDLRIEGGVQDGAAKCAAGGRLAVLKGKGSGGARLDGSAGKGFAYGAQRGTFFVQGVADSRFCIRLSGARAVAGARLTASIDDAGGPQAARAHLKGFAFEYMTAGVAVVLGDPGPWCCAGMTGGVVYVKRWPEFGLDEAALRRRLALGAQVRIRAAGPRDAAALGDLLAAYRAELEASGQPAEAAEVARILAAGPACFMAVEPALSPVATEVMSTE
ncbi:MAG: hypothetical protein FJZ01_20700 [Candidatus Sericytochromatia bacterium]|nr:hypothetical protein [Candidatus Tanganyikabacteria bacterium]